MRRSPCFATPNAHVHKLDARGREVYAYPARVLWRGPASITVAAVFRMPNMSVGGLPLATGDCFVETYYANRWYNIFAIYARETSRLRGWYANIGEPVRLSGNHIAYRDLALDLVVLPTGQHVVLDADEFAALPLAPAERRRALAALADLQARFRRVWSLLA